MMIDGDIWKKTRKQFNGAFSLAHLYTLLPGVLDKVDRFIARLDDFAEKGTEFELGEYCTTLTFDIIGMFCLGIFACKNFLSQKLARPFLAQDAKP